MSQAENYARDTYALKDMYYKGAEARNKPAYEATDTWWKKLQEFEGQPGYGSIPVDWSEIWDRSLEKVRYSYWGDPGGSPGLAGKVKASAARRGVSDSPALQTQLSRMGMQEASDIRQLATTQATEESTRSETGRLNWLTSLQNLSGQKTEFNPNAYPYPSSDAYGGGGGGGVSIPGLITGGLGAIGGVFAGPGGAMLGGASGYAAGAGLESLFTGGGGDQMSQLMSTLSQGGGGYQDDEEIQKMLDRYSRKIPGAVSGTAGAAKPGIKGYQN